ncbi:putative Zn(II)2Cys6 transcription factor [Paraphoma chrysanthemicola]|uniref:Zn(II)2Cys6 transcription factor n=1 Tax=Paraphoma chrysanthemicola TaxID=798071 RepID=A0A8K0VXS8_9PLEO|nr:putative Zn(II)2Cys6 transcription factor [Paraphoma chrysanthemicola]
MPVPPTSNARTHPKKRAAGACEACHARKVRCSLAHTGSPCINCSLDSLACEPRVTKKRGAAPHRRARRNLCSASSSADTVSACPNQTTPQHDSPAFLEASSALRSGRCPQDAGAFLTSAAESRDRTSAVTPYQPLAEHFSHYGGENDLGALQSTENASEPQYAPIYGDPRGVSLVADICEPQRKGKSGHVLVPQTCLSNIDAETLDYLRLKGVFDLPSKRATEMMMQTYFSYVHPFFPVIEAKSLIEHLEDQSHTLSIHLLWSMFLAAANFADDAILEATHFVSRKEMKRSMYAKAKALYDAEYEKNKITLIQAVLLMGFWYADTEDRAGPWHWNGVAISLCQTVGLHRDPEPNSNQTKSIVSVDRKLWQQLWWSCFYREIWFSAGMGRPMRIRLVDCNTKMPDTHETGDFESLSADLRKKYLPVELKDLGKLWRSLLNLTVILSNLLIQQQQADRVLATESEVQITESEIRACNIQRDEIATHEQSELMRLYMYHFEIYVESVSLMLYRPFFLHDSADPSFNGWRSIVEQKARSSAAATTKILSGMISSDSIHLAQSIICIALVPTLQIHLLDYASPRTIIQRMGHQHLELCMIVVEELKKTLFGAEILFRMFTKARKQISDRRSTTFTAVPLVSQDEPLTSPSFAPADTMIDITQDEGRNPEYDLGVFSTMWNADALMTSYGLMHDFGHPWLTDTII